MRDLRVAEASPGMILAKPVLDRMGRILLQKGEELTQPILNRLEAWGVVQVSVESPRATDPDEAIDPLSESQIVAAIESRLELQFERHAGDPRMQAIKESAKKALMKRSGQG